MPLARPRGNISHPECTSVPAAQVAGMRITRGMGMVMAMSFFSLQVQGSFFFSQFLFSHSPRSLDALSVASTALKTGPRPKRRAQKTSIGFVSSGLPFAQPACPPCTSLKTASSLRMPGGFCAKAAADNIDSRTSPRLSSGSARGQLDVLRLSSDTSTSHVARLHHRLNRN